MANPLAYFTYNADGLDVTFTNLSQNITGVTTYLWDFGDGNTSTLKDPTHTYTGVGFFDVGLTVDNTIDPPVTFTLRVGVNAAGKPALNTFNLLQMVERNLPAGVTLDTNQVVSYIRGWQEFIFPSVDPPTDEADKYNETCYTPLANELISKLVTVDMILLGANAYLLNQGNSSGASSKDVKKVVTGPAESEWFSNSDQWYAIMRPGGILEGLQNQCCGLASNLGIYLPFCPAPHNVTVPKVEYNEKSFSINKFTF